MLCIRIGGVIRKGWKMNKIQAAIKVLAEDNDMMVEADPKSGKWWYEEGLDIFLTGYNIFDHDGRFIGAVAKEKYARKIAVLPDLLEAAELADKLLDDLRSYCHGHDSHIALKQAIAKAKGVE